MAHELANLTGEALADAITNALRERLDREQRSRRTNKRARQRALAAQELIRSCPVFDERSPADRSEHDDWVAPSLER